MKLPRSAAIRAFMRLGVFAFFAALWVCVTPAAAQTSITLDANPAPIVDAEINGRPVRLEVDLRMGGVLALSQSAAERLRVRRVPFVALRFGLEGSNTFLHGRMARPRLVFEGGDSRALAGIFAAPVSVRADGVVGPGALPYDIVTVHLGPDLEGARDITFTLEDADEWSPRVEVGGHQVQINFDVTKQATVFNRPAVRHFDGTGAIPASGDLVELPVILGLRTLMQPVTTELTVAGMGLNPAFARTNAALLGADEPDAVIVEADAEGNVPPRITLGRAALSRCSSISVDRRTKRLTLRCAA